MGKTAENPLSALVDQNPQHGRTDPVYFWLVSLNSEVIRPPNDGKRMGNERMHGLSTAAHGILLLPLPLIHVHGTHATTGLSAAGLSQAGFQASRPITTGRGAALVQVPSCLLWCHLNDLILIESKETQKQSSKTIGLHSSRTSRKMYDDFSPPLVVTCFVTEILQTLLEL